MAKKSIGSGRGSVYNVLLKALQTGDKYAYEICKEIEEKTNGAYVLKEQSSYSGLRRLEQRNEITSYWKDSALGGRRHYYSLTEKGRLRLENSNFTWEDTRDEIVDNLFEKSETDKKLDDVSDQLSQIKSTISTENQNEIDEIIRKTDSLVENQQEDENNSEEDIEKQVENAEEMPKQDESAEVGQDNQEQIVKEESDENPFDEHPRASEQSDLFSIFADYSSNEEEKQEPEESVEEEYEEYEAVDDEENAKESSDNENVENEENQELDEQEDDNLPEESKQEEPETISLFSFLNESKNKTESSEVEDEETSETENENDEQDEQLDKNQEQQVQDADDQDENDDLFAQQHDEPIEEDLNNTEESAEDTELSDDETQEQADSAQDDKENENLIENQNEETIEETTEKDDFSALMQNLQTVENKDDSPENFTSESNQKQFLQKNNQDIDFYRQMHKSTNNYVDNTYEEKSTFNFFDDFPTDFDLSEKEEPVIEEKPQQSEQFVENKNDDLIEAESKNENQQSEIISGERTFEQSKTIDYRDIFGDLVSKDNEQQEKPEEVNTYEPAQEIQKPVEQPNERPDPSPYVTERPQNVDNTSYNYYSKNSNQEVRAESDGNPFNDINLTLMSNGKSRIDEMYEMQNNYNEFEKYDDVGYYQDENIYSNQDIDTTHNVAFDKKYDNLENTFEVPNYKIRYQQKPTQKRQSRFILSNKLNLISNLMLCLLLAICNTITLLICKSIGSDNFQIVFCNICYGIMTSIILVSLIMYMINPAKRIHNLKKYDLIISLSICAIILVLTFMINIWAGMTLQNFSNYIATLIMPIFFGIALVLSHATKRILANSNKFYK